MPEKYIWQPTLTAKARRFPWHIAYLLGIDEKEPCRIVFNEITKNAIQNAVKHPRAIDKKLVDAQQARRVLDRLVGYKISPLLWRKIRRGLSAGRVQSAALKIICDREKVILDFIPKEYWNITAILLNDSKGKEKQKPFSARLSEYQGKKLTVSSKKEADKVLSELNPKGYVIQKIEEKEKIRKPNPPFTTSSLQQEASNKLGFYTKKTMLIAQQLYEGIEIKDHGTIGLVTYIRTDSVRISDEAQQAVTEYIKNRLFARVSRESCLFKQEKRRAGRPTKRSGRVISICIPMRSRIL